MRICVPVNGTTMDRLYEDLRAHRFHEIRTRELEQFSPHRGGYSLGTVWAEQECQVSDSLMFEVPPRWQAGFQFLIECVSGVVNASPTRNPVDRWGR